MASRQIELLLNGIQDSNGVPLGAGKVYTYIAGTTTPATTYADKNSLTPETNPIILDANGTAQVYADGVYKFVIKDSDDVTYYTYDNMFVGVSDSQLKNSGTSTGSANAYVLTNTIPSTAYSTLDTYRFIANFANTGVATVNIDGLGVKTIKQFDGTALESGDIAISSTAEITYNGTDFLLSTNGAALSNSLAGLQTTLTVANQNNSFTWVATTGGTAPNYTVTLSPAITSYVAGLKISIMLGTAQNAYGFTINVNSLGAKDVVGPYGNDPFPYNFKIGTILELQYDGTNFVVLNQDVWTYTAGTGVAVEAGSASSVVTVAYYKRNTHCNSQIVGLTEFTQNTSSTAYIVIVLIADIIGNEAGSMEMLGDGVVNVYRAGSYVSSYGYINETPGNAVTLIIKRQDGTSFATGSYRITYNFNAYISS